MERRTMVKIRILTQDDASLVVSKLIEEVYEYAFAEANNSNFIFLLIDDQSNTLEHLLYLLLQFIV